MTEETLQPRSLGDAPPPGPPRKTDPGFRGLWTGAAVVLALGLGAVWWFSRSGPPGPPPPPTPTPVPPPTATPDPALRKGADGELNRLLEIMGPLKAASPELWAPEVWSRVMAASDRGDRAMAEGNWPEAEAAYREARRLAEPLAEGLPEVPGRLLPKAREAYARGAREEAERLLQVVLQVEPDHPEAVALLPRARTADRSFALRERARAHLEDGKPDLAYLDLNRLMDLDAAFPGGKELRDQVSEVLAREELSGLLGRAVRALDERDLETARAAVREASDLAPGDPGVRDVQRQLEERERQRQVLQLREQAGNFEQQEQWRRAYETWLEISSLDPDTPWVREGLARSLKWRLVQEKLVRGLANPGGTQTAQWLREFGTREDWPPGLAAKGTQLEDAHRAMTTPVTVTLVSDGETEVRLDRVGRWKNLMRREVNLLPGRYVVRGGRDGYRDVREEFEVKPGQQGLVVEVICREGIF